MTSPNRTHAWSTALVPFLVVALAAGACSRKKAPETDITTTTTGVDTSGVRPGAPEPEDVMGDRLDEARATIAEMIFFEFNRYEIKPEARDVLARKADVLDGLPEVSIRIEGHADERGTVEYNLALGERRAQAAKDYLVNAGIDPDRISTISYGEERPTMDESSEEAWSQNRRDEFVITSGSGGGI